MLTITRLLLACLALGFSGASISVKKSSISGPEQGTELVFVFMIHRHGDRTPEEEVIKELPIFYKNDQVKALIDPWGFGQLTHVGLGTAYKLGEFIRSRYDGFVASRYNDSEIYIYSSDVTRVKMTVATAMDAVFRPVGKSWRQDFNWLPGCYTAPPTSDDKLIDNTESCPKLKEYFKKKEDAKNCSVLSDYQAELAELGNLVHNNNIMKYPAKVFKTWEVLSSLISLGYDIGEELRQLYSKLSGAFDASWAFMFDEHVAKLSVGLLLNEFFEHADKMINGKQTQKVRWYSAHDSNVYSLQVVTKVHPEGGPKYGSLYSLELRRDVATGQYVVLPVYLVDPKTGTVTYPQVEGCDGVVCDYQLFKHITTDQRLDEEAWLKKCHE